MFYISTHKDQIRLEEIPVLSSQLKPQERKNLHHQIWPLKPCASLP
jgi:hypothetical protein